MRPPFLRLFFIIALFASWHARAATTGEIPVQYRDGFLWLKVEVAGHPEPLHFVLDSGAASSVLDLAAARRLEVNLGRGVSVQGVHSRAAARRVDRFKARAGGIPLPESLLALDLGAISKTLHRPVDGLLGADFFRGRVMQIDFDTGTLRLLDRAQPNSRCAVLPMKTRNGTFCVAVNIAGNPSQWMRVDTGCDSALEWARQNRAPRSSGTSIGLTSARADAISAAVQLGSCALQDIKIGVHERQMFPGEAGLLGNALLSRFRVTFDAPGRRLLLESK